MADGFENNQKKSKQSNGRGGRRNGAGRKPGAVTTKTRQYADLAAASGELTPLDFMLQALRDESNDFATRMDAAKAAAPYIHAKLAAVDANVAVNGSMTVITEIALSGPDEG